MVTREELIAALDRANDLITELMPGVKFIALQDYGELNDCLIDTERLLKAVREEKLR